MAKFEYYLGIDPKDREALESRIEWLNSCDDWRMAVKIISEFDDPNGYLTFQIEANGWDSYRHFLREAHNEGFVKSLTHYE